ncbi:MAG: DNA polymerase ligase N-terminal domain-containing protein [Candidatus Hadarchaeum sp.]
MSGKEISNQLLRKAKDRFVVHEHQARRAGLHWDIRVEKDGVLKSFATKKFPEFVSGERRMILLFEQPDHSVDWLDFEGRIEDEYGMGEIKIIDSGKSKVRFWSDDKRIIAFDGKKLNGVFGLIRYDKNSFLLLKMKK